MTTDAREHAPANEAYDRWAAGYDHDDNPLVALDDEVLPSLYGDVGGQFVLDLACGTGRHTQRLLDRGARVTGLDFSVGMLAEARARFAGRDVRLLEHDLRQPLPFAEASFDRVLSALALEHLQDLVAFFREAARVVKPGGLVLVSDMHPAMRLRGVQANFDDDRGVNVRVEGYEHPVAEYVMSALAAGLELVEIAEHKGREALLARSAKMAKYLGWPMLVTLAARRPGS